jgi:P27 family predicted phage terminase small subunit
MRGRVPRPREERIREGKTRNLPEPVRVTGRAELADVLLPPAHLSRDAKAWWEDVTPVLAEAGLLERVDAYVLAMAAEAWGDVMACDRVIREKGLFAMGSVGNVVPGPWMKVRRDAMLLFERYVNHLALSPVARTRLGLAGLQAASIAQAMDRELGPSDPQQPEGISDADVVEILDDADVGVPGL